jgi:hypothetical protein
MPFSPCSLLHQAEAIFVGTVTEVNEQSLMRRFRVTESFRGVTGDYVDMAEFPTGQLRFKLGQQYLVFAAPWPWEGPIKGCLTPLLCSPTLQLEYAGAIVEQLRAEKSGRRVAAVYGTLESTLAGGLGMWEEAPQHLLPNILVRLQSGGKSFEARTDEYGVYAFDRLPPGKYQVSADLPPNMVLGELIGDDPAPPFELPRRSCFENDLYALPAGRVSGKVVGPDGNPLHFAAVELYRASRYKEGKRGIFKVQGKQRILDEWKPFEFLHLPADDYVLVFNPSNEEDPNAPFPMTFYPHATDLESAQLIHLSEGQQVLNADIRVSSLLPTRQITVRFDWGGRAPQDFYPPHAIAKASRGAQPRLVENGRDGYALTLLLGARYTIHGEAYCKGGKTIGKVETDDVTIDGNSPSVSEVTLKFDRGECVPMRK